MAIVLRILYTVLILGALIFVHELGHFIAAKIFGVRVTEFSMGMGPALLKKQGKETLYALRLFPIGGYCAMTGEDEEVENDPRAMRSKPVWQRMIIVLAGATMNFLLGILLVAIVTTATPIASTTVARFREDSLSVNGGLQINDQIIAVNGNRVNDYTGLASELARCYHQNTARLTVLRDGNEVILEQVPFPTETVADDMESPVIDFVVFAEKKTVGTVIKYTFRETAAYSTMVFESLADLITGKISVKYMSGPVGISGVISEAASYGWESLLTIAAILTVNLGIMNLLPLPALDGGRFLFMLLEVIFRRPVPAKVEGIIHAVGLFILFALMIVIAFKDLFFPIY